MKTLFCVAQEDISSSVIPAMAPGDHVPVASGKKKKKRVEEWKEEDMKSLSSVHLMESQSKTERGSAISLNETRSAKKLVKPPRVEEAASTQLLEWCDSPMGWYQESSDPKERLRSAVGSVVQAILDLAYEGMGDDGKSFKPYKDGEDSYWSAAQKAVRKEVNVDDMMKQVEVAKKVLKSYQE